MASEAILYFVFSLIYLPFIFIFPSFTFIICLEFHHMRVEVP